MFARQPAVLRSGGDVALALRLRSTVLDEMPTRANVTRRTSIRNPRQQPLQRIPDLYIREILPEARRLYDLAIAHVLRQPDDVIRVSRAVRRHALKHADTWTVCSMLRWETEALIERRSPADAWRTWLLLRRHVPASARSTDQFLEGALLYFNGRFEEARQCFEPALHRCIERESPSGFNLLFRIFNSDNPPANVHRVTLTHIYQALARPLDEWSDWPRFVSQLGGSLLRAVRLKREELESHPGRLEVLFQRIERIRRTRVWTGVSRGEEDVVSSPEEVERSQRRIARTRKSSDEALMDYRRKVHERMEKYFGVAAR